MLTDVTLAYLSTLTYRVDAKRGVCVFPLASILRDDEMPLLDRVPVQDRDQIFLLFAIRSKIWDQVPLSADEIQLWDQARSRAADWALLQRLVLSVDEHQARENAEGNCERALEELFASADQVIISRDERGFEKFAATFRLDKDHKSPKRRSWWSVISRRLKRWVRSRNL